MASILHAFLADDHARLDALLRRGGANRSVIDRPAYAEFRSGRGDAARALPFPAVPVASHFDGPRLHEHIASLLKARAGDALQLQAHTQRDCGLDDDATEVRGLSQHLGSEVEVGESELEQQREAPVADTQP